MLAQIINCLFAGMSVGIDALLSVLPIYEQLNNLKEWLLASILGIPLVVISVILLIVKIIDKKKYITNT